MARRVGFSPIHDRRFAVNVVGGGVLDAPRRGQDPSLRCKRHMGGNGKVAGRACPAPTGCHKWVADERGKGGRQPAPFAVGGWLPVDEWHSKVAGRACPAPTDCRFRQRGFGGAWRRTTSAASLLRKPARAVVCPAGANIARSPVSLRSTVAPRSQPRNTRISKRSRGRGR